MNMQLDKKTLLTYYSSVKDSCRKHIKTTFYIRSCPLLRNIFVSEFLLSIIDVKIKNSNVAHKYSLINIVGSSDNHTLFLTLNPPLSLSPLPYTRQTKNNIVNINKNKNYLIK